jgi:hypothetical protein
VGRNKAIAVTFRLRPRNADHIRYGLSADAPRIETRDHGESFGLAGFRPRSPVGLRAVTCPTSCRPFTELILNALTHVFPDSDKPDFRMAVEFDVVGTNWKLSVRDTGIGAPIGVFAQPKSVSTTVSVSHSTFSKAVARSAVGGVFFSPMELFHGRRV